MYARSLVIGLVVAALAAPAHSRQEPVVSKAAAVTQTARGAIGFGPDYDVTVQDGWTSFSLRERAETALRFRLDSVQRSEGPAQQSSAPGKLSVTGGTVILAHSSSVRERLTFRPDGLKHDVILDHLPDSRGDLVVRLRMDTELRGVVDAGGEALYRSVTGDGIRFGQVVGIDAKGRREIGRLRLEEGAIELILPEAFVASAELPLTVDPLIGAHWIYGSPASGESASPDVAFSEVWGVFGAVWERRTPSGRTLICFTTMNETATQLIETQVLDVLDGGEPYDLRSSPVLTDIFEGELFVVAWSRIEPGMPGEELYIQLLGTDGPGSPWYLLQDDSRFYYRMKVRHVAIGGHEERAMIAFDDTIGDVWGVFTQFGEEGFQLSTQRNLDDGETFDARPAIAHSPEALVVWEQGMPGDRDVVGRVLNPIHSGTAIQRFFDDPTRDEHSPDCAGSDWIFTVTCQSTDGEQTDLMIKQVLDNGVCPDLCYSPIPTIVDTVGASFPVEGPRVGMAQEHRAVVVWGHRLDATRKRLMAASYKSNSFGLCEAPFLVTLTNGPLPSPRIADNTAALGLLVLWAGDHPYFGGIDTRGALIRPCK